MLKPPLQRDNDLDDVMRLIASTVAAVAPSSPSNPWHRRLVLGIWAANYLPLASRHLPHFPLTYISFSLPCAYHFLRTVPRIGFNLFASILAGPVGAAFRRKARRLRRPVFAWTVNKERAMRWCVEKGVDGCVTDDPVRFLEVCRRWDGGDGGGGEETEEGRWRWEGWSFAEVADLVRVQVFVWLLTPVVWWWLRPWGVTSGVQGRKGGMEA